MRDLTRPIERTHDRVNHGLRASFTYAYAHTRLESSRLKEKGFGDDYAHVSHGVVDGGCDDIGELFVRRRHSERAGYVRQGHRPHLSGKVPGLPSQRLDGADVADHLRRDAAMGEIDQAARGAAANAAVAYRRERRCDAFQERSFLERAADRDHREVGGRGRSAGQSQGYAAAEKMG